MMATKDIDSWKRLRDGSALRKRKMSLIDDTVCLVIVNLYNEHAHSKPHPHYTMVMMRRNQVQLTLTVPDGTSIAHSGAALVPQKAEEKVQHECQ